MVPNAPINLQNDADTTDAFNIRFTWAEGVENGGTEVLDFIVYFDQGIDSYIELESGIIDSSYTTSVALTPDVNYSFKVQARNAVGRGAISEPITIKAARVPDAPINLANVPEITTAYQIGLTWEPGLNDGGSAVLDYRLSVNMHSADSFTIYRDDITETALTILGLEPGVTYTFKIESRNLVGYSDYSNTVAILAAQIPDPPIYLADVPAATKADRIGLVWQPPIFNGGSPIIDYRLWYDDATGSNFIVREEGLQLSYTALNLVKG